MGHLITLVSVVGVNGLLILRPNERFGWCARQWSAWQRCVWQQCPRQCPPTGFEPETRCLEDRPPRRCDQAGPGWRAFRPVREWPSIPADRCPIGHAAGTVAMSFCARNGLTACTYDRDAIAKIWRPEQ